MVVYAVTLFVTYLPDLKCNLMEGLPECLPVGQVTLKSYLPDLKNYLSRTTRQDFCRALLHKVAKFLKVINLLMAVKYQFGNISFLRQK